MQLDSKGTWQGSERSRSVPTPAAQALRRTRFFFAEGPGRGTREECAERLAELLRSTPEQQKDKVRYPVGFFASTTEHN